MEWKAWTRESGKLSFISSGAKILIECKCQARKFLRGTKGAIIFQSAKVAKG